jgi:hypothetical protein
MWLFIVVVAIERPGQPEWLYEKREMWLLIITAAERRDQPEICETCLLLRKDGSNGPAKYISWPCLAPGSNNTTTTTV